MYVYTHDTYKRFHCLWFFSYHMQDTLSLVVKDRYELVVKLPAQVDEDSTKARFNTKIAMLTITMPCL